MPWSARLRPLRPLGEPGGGGTNGHHEHMLVRTGGQESVSLREQSGRPSRPEPDPAQDAASQESVAGPPAWPSAPTRNAYSKRPSRLTSRTRAAFQNGRRCRARTGRCIPGVDPVVRRRTPDGGGCALAQQHADVALAALVGVGVADRRQVVEGRVGARRQVVVVAFVVRLRCPIGVVVALLDDDELPLAGPAVGPVDASVGDPTSVALPTPWKAMTFSSCRV